MVGIVAAGAPAISCGVWAPCGEVMPCRGFQNDRLYARGLQLGKLKLGNAEGACYFL